MIRSICVLFFGLMAAPAASQDLVFDMSATDTCLAETTDPDVAGSCIGASANACMESSQGGSSTVGMGFCLAAEQEAWDDRLNEVYRSAMAAHRASDAEYKPYLSEADSLRDAQRAWIAWRDANCLYEVSTWGGGTGGGPAGTSCNMRMTAERALELGWRENSQ